MRRPFACLFALTAATVAHADAPDPAPAPDDATGQRGHGSVSIGFQDTYIRGLRVNDHTVVDSGKGRNRALQLDAEYFVTDSVSLLAGIPFVSNVFVGYPHCPTALPTPCRHIPRLTVPHPETHFIDDGNYHGTWQDVDLGVAHHAVVHEDYALTTSLTAYFPSHNYTFFSEAAPGQRIWQVEAAVELSHQFAFSPWFWRARYGYVLAEKVLDTRLDHHRANLELGYFVNEDWSLRAFTDAKRGDGYTVPGLAPLTRGRTSEYWYHHDQLIVHDYADVGVGVDHRIAQRYTVSAAVHKLVWGRSVNNFDYSAELRLTREF